VTMLLQQTTVTKRSRNVSLRGVVHLHKTSRGETLRAFQEARFMMAPWSSDGRYILKDGDELTIFSKKDPSVIVWQGTFSSGRALGISGEKWFHWFHNGYPSELKPT